jgi:ankyrin repeat protein
MKRVILLIICISTCDILHTSQEEEWDPKILEEKNRLGNDLITAVEQEQIAQTTALLTQIVDLDHCTAHYPTALHLIICRQYFRSPSPEPEISYFVVSELLKRKPDTLNVQDYAGCTPLLRATLKNNVGAVTALLKQGANPNIASTDWVHGFVTKATPLWIASWLGYELIAEKLLQAKAKPDVNYRARQDETPLRVTLKYGHFGLARLLLTHEADPNIPDRDGEYPIQGAFNAGYEDTEKIQLLAQFFKRGAKIPENLKLNPTQLHLIEKAQEKNPMEWVD